MQRLLLLLLFAIPAQAQYVQGGGVNPSTGVSNWQQLSAWSYTFPAALNQLGKGCTILVSVRYPNEVISDSQGNAFALATNNLGKYDQLWYSKTCSAGPDTITSTCPNSSPCWQQMTVSEYSGVWVADQVSPEVQNVVGTQGYTPSITPSVNGALIIGIGNNHTDNVPVITGTDGFTVRANANQFIADMIQTTAAPIYSEVSYSAPVNWCQWTVSFKPIVTGPVPQPLSITVKAMLLWCVLCNQTDNVPVTGNLVIAQLGGPTSTYNILSNGSVSASSMIDVAQDPLQFTLMLTDSTGVAQPGANLTLTFPRFELASPGFTLGTISLGVVRLAHTTDDSGNPAVRIVDVSQFSLGK